MKIDSQRRAAFIQALEDEWGNFSAACRIASPHSTATNGKPCYSSFRRLMNVSPGFSQEVAEAMARVKDKVAEEITKRAINGTETPVFQKGERAVDHDGSPASITSHDNKLLLRLAAKLDPENWGLQEQRHDHRVTVHSTGRALVNFGMQDLEYLAVDRNHDGFYTIKRRASTRFEHAIAKKSHKRVNNIKHLPHTIPKPGL